MNAREMREMNQRIADRWSVADTYPEIPIHPPSWAAKVVDSGEEILAIHSTTGAPYPLVLHHDLEPEDLAVIVCRRLLATGGSPSECERFLRAFSLPAHALRRLSRQMNEASR